MWSPAGRLCARALNTNITLRNVFSCYNLLYFTTSAGLAEGSSLFFLWCLFFRQDGGSWSPDKRSVPRHGSVLSRRGCYDHEESSTSITSSGSTAPRRPTCKLQLTCAITSHVCFYLIYGDVHYSYFFYCRVFNDYKLL